MSTDMLRRLTNRRFIIIIIIKTATDQNGQNQNSHNQFEVLNQIHSSQRWTCKQNSFPLTMLELLLLG